MVKVRGKGKVREGLGEGRGLGWGLGWEVMEDLGNGRGLGEGREGWEETGRKVGRGRDLD